MKHIVALPFLALLATACAHDEVVAACTNFTCEGDDVGACISPREGNLGEVGGRCGDEGTAAVLAIYVCQGTLTCDTKDTYEVACVDEIAAYADLRAAGEGGCPGAPDAVIP